MPMRALRASRGYATAHIAENLWLWIGISAAGMLLTGLLMYYFERGTSYTAGKSHWGDAMAFFAMVLGSLVMIKSQEGFVSTHVLPAEDDAADLPAPASGPGLGAKPA